MACLDPAIYEHLPSARRQIGQYGVGAPNGAASFAGIAWIDVVPIERLPVVLWQIPHALGNPDCIMSVVRHGCVRRVILVRCAVQPEHRAGTTAA